MHVCVLGGGVVGVTTAYCLAREGLRVTVLERHPNLGMETTFANGGQLSYSYVAPLAGPSVPGRRCRAGFPNGSSAAPPRCASGLA